MHLIEKISVEEIIQNIKTLCNIPSPSGFAFEVVDYIEKRWNQLGVDTQQTYKGGLIGTIPGEYDDIQRTITAHVDTLGAMVKEITGDGRLRLTKVGGFTWNSVEGEYCTILTSAGKTYRGTILFDKSTVHVYSDIGREVRADDNMSVRLDEVVRSEEDVRALGIEVGDYVAFDPRVEVSSSGFLKSRHLDDKASVGILMEVVKLFQENGAKPKYTTHFYISNNEEIGYGANSNIPHKTKEFLAVDMGAIGSGQATDEFCVSICAKDSSGPYHYKLRQKLVSLAKENEIYYKVDIYPNYGSDASAAMHSGTDIIHGLIGPGIDASHAMERTHKEALSNTAKLLMHYLLSE